MDKDKNLDINNSFALALDTKRPITPKATGSREWDISISFGKSKSSNFKRALFLAKAAPRYFEDTTNGEEVFQATYTSDPDNYLAFIKLYELVGQWKSSYVAINGAPVDRKIIGNLNYCYGDKCRSGNTDFCFGASEFTKNPFGCHRLQVSECNNPWWSFGKFDNNGIWHTDFESIISRIVSHAVIYELCPSFSEETVLKGLYSLPRTINPAKDNQWEYSPSGGIEPRERIGKYRLNVSLTIDPPAQNTGGLLNGILDLFKRK